MPALTRADLNFEYSWSAVPGDNPNLTKVDAQRFSRAEGYEVLHLLNSLTAQGGGDLAKRTRLICEWMIQAHLPGSVQGRSKVINWIAQNFSNLKADYPF